MASVTLFELLAGCKKEQHFEDIEIVSRWIKTLFFDGDVAELSAVMYWATNLSRDKSQLHRVTGNHRRVGCVHHLGGHSPPYTGRA